MIPMLFLLNLCNRLSIYFSTLKSKAKSVCGITKQSNVSWRVVWYSKGQLKCRASEDGSGITQKLLYLVHSTFTPRNPNQLQLIPPGQEIKKLLSKGKNSRSVAKLAHCWWLTTVPLSNHKLSRTGSPLQAPLGVRLRLVLSFCWSDGSFLHAFGYKPPETGLLTTCFWLITCYVLLVLACLSTWTPYPTQEFYTNSGLSEGSHFPFYSDSDVYLLC